MLLAVDTMTTFHPFANDGVELVQCSTCAALVPDESKNQHKRYHDDVLAVARKAGLTR